jgi:hypothetical protein
MSLLRSEKDNFDIEVFYVFDKNGQMNVLDEDIDLDTIKKTKEEREKMDIVERSSSASDIPFNQTIDLLDYSEKDLKKAVFTFRRPSFDDMPVLLSSFMNVSAKGEISPGSVFEFSDKKLKLLFVKGTAKEEDDSDIKITSQNLGKIPPVLGSAMSVKMTKILNM